MLIIIALVADKHWIGVIEIDTLTLDNWADLIFIIVSCYGGLLLFYVTVWLIVKRKQIRKIMYNLANLKVVRRNVD